MATAVERGHTISYCYVPLNLPSMETTDGLRYCKATKTHRAPRWGSCKQTHTGMVTAPVRPACRSCLMSNFHAMKYWRKCFLAHRSEEHTSELQSLMRISYAVFCLNKKIQRAMSTAGRVRYQVTMNSNTYSRS